MTATNKERNMKKIVNITEVDGEGLIGLLGQRVTLLCANYFYTGLLVGVNGNCVRLDDPSIVYETGEWTEKEYKDSQRLPGTVYVMLNAVESFGAWSQS